MEQIIIYALAVAGIIHVACKWRIRLPIDCEFCTAFWLLLVVFVLQIKGEPTGWLQLMELWLVFIKSLAGAVLSFYVLMRINIYENTRKK